MIFNLFLCVPKVHFLISNNKILPSNNNIITFLLIYWMTSTRCHIAVGLPKISIYQGLIFQIRKFLSVCFLTLVDRSECMLKFKKKMWRLLGTTPFSISSSARLFAQLRNVLRRNPFIDSRRLRRYESLNGVLAFTNSNGKFIYYLTALTVFMCNA